MAEDGQSPALEVDEAILRRLNLLSGMPDPVEQLSDLRVEDSRVPAAQRLTERLQQFLPSNNARRVQLEGWFALYASAIGPERTEQGARLLVTLTQHTQDRVQQWLRTREGEGTLREGGIGVARHLLNLAIKRVVVE